MSNGLPHSPPPAVSKLRVEGVPKGTEGLRVTGRGCGHGGLGTGIRR